MNTYLRTVLAVVLAASLLALGAAGCSNRSAQNTGVSLPRDTALESAVQPVAPQGAPGTTASDKASSGGQSTASAATPQRMVVSKASMSIQVDELTKSVEQVRAITAAAGGTISQLSYSQGGSTTPITPQGENSSAGSQPSTAQLVLRIPASKLPEVEKSAAALGSVLSQTAEESDVTQEHVDLVARIDNLKAEEIRLRKMLDQAKNVSEMLAVERELARVQGDIESMQAQLAYLERQAAQATLSLNLSEPGALVRPASGGWGLGSAVTFGVQAAAAILRTIIASLIALSPLLLIGLLIWALVRGIRRRRKAKQEPVPEVPAE